ncbi:hypothetical protein BU25DRAFT_409741 [Macroventuria anomochaeta]|uniref:Uncharacterized protein n=1 Tax=Macroventuria anomochaeta TaxID=301207 RepID=A0ACB6S385_9PLEO|nr:uncharacterized protein BU25DRAFT_409741 [Macroventuria anomochaeta]KAF2628716.1 hypothetical protein BU25DRAFT_409741 [Macroventuria anomochaeta]
MTSSYIILEFLASGLHQSTQRLHSSLLLPSTSSSTSVTMCSFNNAGRLAARPNTFTCATAPTELSWKLQLSHLRPGAPTTVSATLATECQAYTIAHPPPHLFPRLHIALCDLRP